MDNDAVWPSEEYWTRAKAETKERQRLARIDYQRRVRAEALRHYGPVCDCCGEEELRFLSFDHANGDGKEDRLRTLGRTNGGNYALYLYKKGWPDVPGLHVLCYNCHYSRHHYGCCPHKEIKQEGDEKMPTLEVGGPVIARPKGSGLPPAQDELVRLVAMVPAGLFGAVESAARARGLSMAALVRVALAAELRYELAEGLTRLRASTEAHPGRTLAKRMGHKEDWHFKKSALDAVRRGEPGPSAGRLVTRLEKLGDRRL